MSTELAGVLRTVAEASRLPVATDVRVTTRCRCFCLPWLSRSLSVFARISRKGGVSPPREAPWSRVSFSDALDDAARLSSNELKAQWLKPSGFERPPRVADTPGPRDANDRRCAELPGALGVAAEAFRLHCVAADGEVDERRKRCDCMT